MPSANRVRREVKKSSASAAPAYKWARPLALVLIVACLAASAFNSSEARTQTHTRPRKASPAAGSSNPDATQTRKNDAGKVAAGGAGASEALKQEAQKQPGRQSVEDAEAIDEDEVVKISSSEVLLPVTVRDASGRLVSDLKREDFRVYEEGREQPLSELSLRRVPVDVALLVDSSSSVAASFEDFRRAAEEFASRLDAEDRISLIKFDDRVELLLDWTQSRLQLRRALRRLTTGVFTRFNDALLLQQHRDRARAQAVGAGQSARGDGLLSPLQRAAHRRPARGRARARRERA
ncbi:MAG: VWA domain-containing protein [Acidobacteria bacterium]|nr:VWA domain-containing protein [Acidobacteriota bacterium]